MKYVLFGSTTCIICLLKHTLLEYQIMGELKCTDS